ncbi:hypothetical protein RBB50_010764 [Rhinocladiella similis]
MASFEGKVILLVGGASGVGLATAKLLASRGAHLSVADVNADVTTVIAQQIPSTDKVKVTAHQVDITDQSAVQALIVATMKEHGRIDGCANIAGVIGRLNGLNIWETERSQFDFVMGVNAGGLFNLLAAELKPGILPDGASIVNVASILSLRASPKSSPYITSKHAVQGLTKAAAMDAAPRNIRVNCVAPGYINTPMLTTSLELKFGSDPTNWPKATTPLPRYGEPEEIGKVIAFLLSDDASYVTAASYSVDGGWASAQ